MIKFIMIDKKVVKTNWLEKLKKEKIKTIDRPLKIIKLDKCNLKEREHWLINSLKIKQINLISEIKLIQLLKLKTILVIQMC